jgi:osmotically-inducible protein OsmY
VNDEYVVGHLQEALAHSGETDVHVRVANGRVFVTGTVATEARRDTVTRIAASMTDLDVHNEVVVLRCDAPGDREELA